MVESVKSILVGNRQPELESINPTEWVFEYQFNTDRAIGPFTLEDLKIEGRVFFGKGKDEAKKVFEFVGELQEASKKFMIR